MFEGVAPHRNEPRSFAPTWGLRDNAARRPIFLHGMWRSGSTYLWSRFRAASGTRCFYEPLHHGLAKLTQARIERDTPAQISANRHPALSQPYFAEFAPLIDRRGVRGYQKALAYDRYILQPEQACPVLKRYIQGLIDAAASEDECAVLGFNRTGLRIAWLKANFFAYNIHIDREPVAIWASYAAEMAKGNYAFFSMWLTVIEKNANHPLFAPLVERLSLRRPSLLIHTAPKTRHRRLMDAMTEEESYFLIHYLWLACTGHALAECDLVIDTRLADNLDYLRKTAAEVSRATGLRINLDEMRAAEPRLALSRSIQARIEYSAMQIFPRAALPKTPAISRRAQALSPRFGDLLGVAI